MYEINGTVWWKIEYLTQALSYLADHVEREDEDLERDNVIESLIETLRDVVKNETETHVRNQ